MQKSELTFIVFIIYALAEKWNRKPLEVYEILHSSNILNEYLLPNYDVLHTQGKEYLVADITELAEERGVFKC